jgi:hypothetical protein
MRKGDAVSTEKKSLLEREPVLITTLIRSALILAAAFGLRLEADQIAALLVFTEAVLAVLVRSRVTSPATSAAGTPVLAPVAVPVTAFEPRRPTGQPAAG